MKKFYLVVITLFIVFNFSGCSNNPSDIAVEFAQSISNLDAKKAKSLSSKRVQSQIEYLEKFCVRPKVQEVRKAVDKEVKVLFNGFEEKFKNSVLKEYPNIKDMPQKEREKILLEAIEDFIDDAEISNSEYKTEIQEVLKKMFFAVASNARINEKEIITKVLIKQGNTLTKECVEKNSYFADIDSINVIETSDDSSDEKSVKLELVYNDGNSEKITLGLEKIQDEWKIAQSNLLKF